MAYESRRKLLTVPRQKKSLLISLRTDIKNSQTRYFNYIPYKKMKTF